MALLTPEIVADLAELPTMVLAILAGLGLAVWLTGWAFHRFWLASSLTLLGGLVGLRYGPRWGVPQPLVAGLLLALAAGCISLALARVLLFGLFGLSCWALVDALAPVYAVPLVCVCVGGLLSVVCFRFSVLLLTSAAGSLLATYAAFAWAEQMNMAEARAWLLHDPWSAHGIWLALCTVGVLLQYLFLKVWQRYQLWQQRQRELRDKIHVLHERAEAELAEQEQRRSRWWPLVQQQRRMS